MPPEADIQPAELDRPRSAVLGEGGVFANPEEIEEGNGDQVSSSISLGGMVLVEKVGGGLNGGHRERQLWAHGRV